jgi:hypothetical protein
VAAASVAGALAAVVWAAAASAAALDANPAHD